MVTKIINNSLQYLKFIKSLILIIYAEISKLWRKLDRLVQSSLKMIKLYQPDWKGSKTHPMGKSKASKSCHRSLNSNVMAFLPSPVHLFSYRCYGSSPSKVTVWYIMINTKISIFIKTGYLEWRMEHASTTGGANPSDVDLYDVEYEILKAHKNVRDILGPHFTSDFLFWFAWV